MAKKMINIYYQAEDGTQFETEEECLEYEKKCENKAEPEIKRTIKDLHCMELDGLMPLEISGFYTGAKYLWYELASEEDCKILVEACPDVAKSLDISKYPEMVCLEIKDTDENGNCFSIYKLSECMQQVKDFFALFGYDCDIQKITEWQKIIENSTNPVKIFNIIEVLKHVDEALKRYSANILNVEQKDGMIRICIYYYGRNRDFDIFSSNIVRYEDCDISILEQELDKRNIKYYW